MEVNTSLNVMFPGIQNVPNIPKDGVAMQSEKDEIAFKETPLPFEKKKPEISEEVLMDLKDVQNFLYMLVGADLLIKNDDNVAGDTVNVKA